MLTNVHIHALNVAGKTRTIEFSVNGKDEAVEARFILVNFGRNLLAKFTGRSFSRTALMKDQFSRSTCS